MTRVINIKSGEKYDTYIGRAGRNMDGYYGNPHPIGFCKLCNRIHNREDSLKEYKIYFDKRIKEDRGFYLGIKLLKDRVLGCFCKEEDREVPCHGDIIIEYLDKEFTKERMGISG